MIGDIGLSMNEPLRGSLCRIAAPTRFGYGAGMDWGVWCGVLAASVMTAGTPVWAAPAVHAEQGYKLLVAFDRGGMSVINYPSFERCIRAKDAVEADLQRRLNAGRDNMPGAVIIGPPYHFIATCIPG